MNTASLVNCLSRRAGGLFESVRRLHQELLGNTEAQGNNGGIESTRVDVRVLGMRDEFTSTDMVAWAPVPVEVFKPRGPAAFCYAPGLFGKLNALDPDLVHVHGLWQYASVAVVCWHNRCHRPYIVSPHGMLEPWAMYQSRWKKHLGWLIYEGRHLKSAACLRALCRAEADSMRALGLTNPICIIPNGVDLAPSYDWLSRDTKLDSQQACLSDLETLQSDRKVLLYLGRIHPKKGLTNLLKAWAKAQPPDDWVLAIAGWDPSGYEAELKLLASSLGIAWTDSFSQEQRQFSVLFAGPQFGIAKHQWLERCSACILPSFSEGLPMAVLEAWAHAKPALITPQCNLPEGLAFGAAIPIQTDVQIICAGLRALFQASESALRNMGRNGLTLVQNHFSWPKVAAEMKRVYRWMLGEGPKPESVSTVTRVV